MGNKRKNDYIALKVRLESLGVLNRVSKLREATSAQTKKTRSHHRTVYGVTPLRRSQRINPIAATNTAAVADDQIQGRRSQRLNASSSNTVITKQEKVATDEGEQEEKRSANTTLEVEEKTPAKCDYEALRDARLLENKARLESLGVLSKVSQLREASAQTKKSRPNHKRIYGLTPLRRSQRINPITNTDASSTADQLQLQRSQQLKTSSSNLVITLQDKLATNKGKQEKKRPANTTLEVEEKTPAKCDYEALRDARLLENKARLESLGVLSKVSQLREASAQTKKTRPNHKKVYGLTPHRRSQRINPITNTDASSTTDQLQLQRSQQLKTSSSKDKVATNEGPANTTLEVDKRRPANAPLVKLDFVDLLITAESSDWRCNSKGRGSVYSGILGICCHFCRQKKLCGEEDCKRCGNCDVDEPCLGKTDCSVCHSSNGVFCRACLKVRYGEEIEEVRENKEWTCPHCIEEKGINPYWICNSSICMRKRNMSPTGLAIYQAREMGYESVAHLLMEELKRGHRQKR